MIRPGLPKLIATDLDGTLVRSDNTVSDYTREVFDRVRAAGIRIIGATGRGPRLSWLTRRDLPAANFLVMGGGGWVVDLNDPMGPVTLHEKWIDGAVVAGVLATLEQEVGELSVMVEASHVHNAPLWGDFDPCWPYPDNVKIKDRADALAGLVIKGFAHGHDHDADSLLAVARRLVDPDLVTITQAGLGYIEICPPGVDKASGLALVAAALGIEPGEVLAFGDMPNDLPMLRWAGFGRVAVANAHPAVLATVDQVTLTNDADGVAVFLDRLLGA